MTTHHSDRTVRTTYAGRLFSLEVVEWKDADGETISREVVRHPGAVLIVPVLGDGRLVLIHNRRIAVEQALLEFPAGTLEPNEPPEATAARELEEEAGYQADSIDYLGTFYTSPGMSDERMHVFHASGLRATKQKLEPHEEIEVEVMTEEGLLRRIRDGQVQDGKSIAAYFLWKERCAQSNRTLENATT